MTKILLDSLRYANNTSTRETGHSPTIPIHFVYSDIFKHSASLSDAGEDKQGCSSSSRHKVSITMMMMLKLKENRNSN